MGFKINKVKADLCSYPPYILLAERKFGKTTFWYDLVREAWGDDSKGLLVSFGNEEGYHALDGIQVEVAKKWTAPYDPETDLRGFVQIVDDIVEHNDQYGLKGICFDTLDTMVDVATAEVLRLHKIEKGTVCKSLNDAMGGFSKGVTRLLEIIFEQEARLRDAGLAVFYLCHTKNKEKTDLKSGEKYEQITNNLQGNIYTRIADAAQMVMVGLMERDIVNGKIIDEHRAVYLRGTSEVDAGSRFNGNGLPEKIELSPRAFLDAFESAVKGSLRNPSEDLNAMKAREAEEATKKAQVALKKENEEKLKAAEETMRAQYIEEITKKVLTVDEKTKLAFKEKVVTTGCKNIKDDNMPIEALKEILELVSGATA